MQADKLTNSSQFPLFNFGAYLGVDMKRITLTQGKFALVDDEDFERLNQVKWYAVKGKKTFYARRNSSKVNGKQHVIYMHHEIIGHPSRGFEVDHKDNSGLNNQRKNLRFVTRRQNQQNQKKEGKSSIFPGVHWDKTNKKWRAKIQTNGEVRQFGRVVSEFEAFKIYKQAVEALGEKMVEDF